MTKFEWGMVSILSCMAQLRDFDQVRQSADGDGEITILSRGNMNRNRGFSVHIVHAVIQIQPLN